MLRRSRFVAAFLIQIRIERSFVTAALQRGLVMGSKRKSHSSVDKKRCNSYRLLLKPLLWLLILDRLDSLSVMGGAYYSVSKPIW